MTEDASKYQASYQTYDFVQDTRDSTEKAHTALTTQELQLKDGKDGLVLFSNKNTDAKTDPLPTQRKKLILMTMIFIL